MVGERVVIQTMGEEPKLYVNKPRKEQLKQFREQQKGKEFSLPTSSYTSSTMETHSTTPPPPPPKESFARRYKFVWPMLLAVNLAVGAYLFMRTKKKETGVEEEAATSVPSKDAAAHIAETPPSSLPIAELVKRKPIPESQQRELFKWILEEKRKVKSKDPEEKRRIDEEKAILKQFIRAKSIPSV